jgi:glycosyltransferase involved in cell wall biosynthesis
VQKPLIYILHSGQLYGTERMAIATMSGLKDKFQPILLSPPGLAIQEGKRREFITLSFTNNKELTKHLNTILKKYKKLIFFATGLTHSLIFSTLNFFYRRQNIHIHMVHGGTDERASYGRKKYLNSLGIVFVTNSAFTKTRMIANGVRADRIKVIENFLLDSSDYPKREPFTQDKIQRVVVVSRPDPIKRVDLLLDALERTPQLEKLSIRVCGSGWDLEKLRARAQSNHPNVKFLGYTDHVQEELAAADLLVHLCPVEPFGIAILEAMAAGIPVLVPDTGGASTLVEEGVSGFHFRAEDVDDLAKRLLDLTQAEPEQLNQVVIAAREALATRFSATRGIAEYRNLVSVFD